MTDKDEKIKTLTSENDAWENYFRNTIIPQFYIDRELKLRRYTPAATKEFHINNNCIGKDIEEIKDRIKVPLIPEYINNVINSNQIFEKEIQTTEKKWYQINIIPHVSIKTKKTNGVIITLIDITDRINDINDLEKLISDHETLLDTLSHDIKNPLTSLQLSIQILKKNLEDKTDTAKILEVIENSVVTLKDIVYELTDKRKHEYQYKAESEKLDLDDILEDVRLSLMEDITRTKAKVTFDLKVKQIVFSRRKLRSVLYNLLSNAIKYHSPERTPDILVEISEQEKQVRIRIKDNGIGIEEGKKEKIFEKYFRVNDAVEGTGVGLYLVKEIVETSGGKITVTSEVGKGTTINVYLIKSAA